VQSVRCTYPGDEKGRSVVFVDTPPFDDDRMNQVDIGKSIAKCLSSRRVDNITFNSYDANLSPSRYAKKFRVAGILYMHRILDGRMTERPLAHPAVFQNMCGDVDIPRRMLLVTTMWRLVDEEKGSRREEQIRREYWSSMMALGSRMVRFEDKGDSESAWRAVDVLLEMGK
jgi:hypothetical protein